MVFTNSAFVMSFFVFIFGVQIYDLFLKTKKQNPDFLNIGTKILNWYDENARDLPWRKSKNPYLIWISEIILQQTQVKQGLQHYLNFVERFPNVESLAAAETDEVLLYWKGLGYYSRALNLHIAAQQIMDQHKGKFPKHYHDIVALKGIGKYTAAAIASICYNEVYPAIDGNFYRVFSRVWADDFDISKSNAFKYFSKLIIDIIPEHNPGDFNQAIMDLGSEICKPKNPDCTICPINENCLAYQTGTMLNFPVKKKKAKIEKMELEYYFVFNHLEFLIKRRNQDSIWKNLYEFCTAIPEEWKNNYTIDTLKVNHKLTHKNVDISIHYIRLESIENFKNFAQENDYNIVNTETSDNLSFPKPLEKAIKVFEETIINWYQ